MGIKDITICASSLGKAHDKLVEFIEDGTITNIQSSGVRGKIGRAISEGKLKGLAVMRSHGGRVRAIETGEVRIDIAFIGSPTCAELAESPTVVCFLTPWSMQIMLIKWLLLLTAWFHFPTFLPIFP